MTLALLKKQKKNLMLTWFIIKNLGTINKNEAETEK